MLDRYCAGRFILRAILPLAFAVSPLAVDVPVAAAEDFQIDTAIETTVAPVVGNPGAMYRIPPAPLTRPLLPPWIGRPQTDPPHLWHGFPSPQPRCTGSVGSC